MKQDADTYMSKNKFQLSNVTIQGYKSISYDCPLQLQLSNVNILLGANGAGKSNIISFFKMMSYMMSKAFYNYVELNGTSNQLLHFGPKQTPKITAQLAFSNDNNKDIYSFNLENAMSDRLIITDESIEWHQKGKKGHYTVQLTPNFKESALADSDDQTAKAIYSMLSNCKVYQFHDSSSEGPMRQTCPVETANYLQSQANNLPSFLLILKTHYPFAYKRIVDYISDVVPQFSDFYLEPIGNYISLRWKDNSATDYIFNSHQFSDGSIRFIALATLLLQPVETMPQVIILDEPELGLHPYAISQLSEMIKDAALHTQIIIATQSKDLIDYFDVENITVVEMDENKKSTIATKLQEKDLKVWLEHYSLSELWDKNVIGGRP